MPAKFVTHGFTCVYFGRPPFSARHKKNTPSKTMAVQPCQQFSLGDDIDLIDLIAIPRQHKEILFYTSADGAAEQGFLSFYRSLPEVSSGPILFVMSMYVMYQYYKLYIKMSYLVFLPHLQKPETTFRVFDRSVSNNAYLDCRIRGHSFTYPSKLKWFLLILCASFVEALTDMLISGPAL